MKAYWVTIAITQGQGEVKVKALVTAPDDWGHTKVRMKLKEHLVALKDGSYRIEASVLATKIAYVLGEEESENV